MEAASQPVPQVRRWPLALAMITFVIISATLVVWPAKLLQPFAPQTARDVHVAYVLRHWNPRTTLALLGGGVAIVSALVRRTRSRLGRVAIAASLLPLIGLAWLSRQNHFEWMFHPLPEPKFAPAWKVDVDPCDMVLAVVVDGEARAYPVRLLANHHVVNDVVAGRPITATY